MRGKIDHEGSDGTHDADACDDKALTADPVRDDAASAAGTRPSAVAVRPSGTVDCCDSDRAAGTRLPDVCHPCIREEVRAAADELEEHGRLGLTRGYIQHGTITVYDHVVSVAERSLEMADRLERAGIDVDRRSLLRGALLHDYFLYDWHDKDPSHRLHGFRHPFFALERAEEDFDLTPRERNIIVRHMFPLVPIPPTCREAWIVCIADKICALRETVEARLPEGARRAVVASNARSD